MAITDPPVHGEWSSTTTEYGFTRSAWVSIIAEAIRVAGCEFCNGNPRGRGTYWHNCQLQNGGPAHNSEFCHGECTCTCGKGKRPMTSEDRKAVAAIIRKQQNSPKSP